MVEVEEWCEDWPDRVDVERRVVWKSSGGKRRYVRILRQLRPWPIDMPSPTA